MGNAKVSPLDYCDWLDEFHERVALLDRAIIGVKEFIGSKVASPRYTFSAANQKASRDSPKSQQSSGGDNMSTYNLAVAILEKTGYKLTKKELHKEMEKLGKEFSENDPCGSMASSLNKSVDTRLMVQD